MTNEDQDHNDHTIDIGPATGGQEGLTPWQKAKSVVDFDVGRKVRLVREREGMSQEDLADRLALSRTSLTNIEAGRHGLYITRLAQIAYILGVDMSELLPSNDTVSESLHLLTNHRLLSQIEERRGDPEFMARLERIMTEEKTILDRLAKEGD